MPTLVPTLPADGHTACAPHGVYRETRSASGFTLIESLVVMAIFSVLLALALPSFLGSRHSADGKVVQASAVDYRDAIEAFQLDHGNRAPQLSVAADWPSNTQNLPRGPIDMHGDPYLKSIPETITGGDVSIGGPSVASGSMGRIVYERTGPTTFSLTVQVRQDNDLKTLCVLGNAPTAQEDC